MLFSSLMPTPQKIVYMDIWFHVGVQKVRPSLSVKTSTGEYTVNCNLREHMNNILYDCNRIINNEYYELQFLLSYSLNEHQRKQVKKARRMWGRGK